MKQYYVDFVEKYLSKRMNSVSKLTDGEFTGIVDACIGELEKRVTLSANEKDEIRDYVFNSRRRLGILQPLLDDPDVNEIMINGTESIYIEKGGKLSRYEKRYQDASALFNVIQSMVSWVDRSVSESSPIVDARLSDGSRVNIVLRPVALNGPIVTIRKFKDRMLTEEDFLKNECITEEELDFLKKCVRAKVNIFVSGGTSSGKTTFLNLLCGFIDQNERIVTVEDSAELRLTPPNLVRLETKNANSEGINAITMRTLIKASLRMRPDRIIVGEVRDEAAVDMLQAMCTGHDGSMSTAHANSGKDVLTRIETMALWEGNISDKAIKKQIASGLDLVVHMQRDDKMRRFVKEIIAISKVSGDGEEIATYTLFCDGMKVENVQKGGRLYEKLNAKEV